MRHAKIIATIGPRTLDPTILRSLHDAGMGVARLNGSHSDLDWHRRAVETIRAALPDLPILLDIPGRKIRTAQLAHEPSFEAGGTVILTTEPGHEGPSKVSIGHDRLHEALTPGTVILADDGTLRFTVLKIQDRDIHCRAEVAGTLKSRKGINVPSVAFSAEPITKRDAEMIAFAKALGVDFIGISFVDVASQIEAIRSHIGGRSPRIVAKIENSSGLANVDAICTAADAIMIDRGDLSVETDAQSLVLYQKRIIRSAQAAGKPVIVATEMLHSMINNPFPTKAEISDITNAVLDGCSAIMLSGETAIGEFPVAAVQTMRDVADAVSAFVHSNDDKASAQGIDVPYVIEDAIVRICRSYPISKIVAVTLSGYAATTIAAHRPAQPILAVTDDLATARSLNLLYGTEGVYADLEFSRTSINHLVEAIRYLWLRGKLVSEDVVLVTGVGYPKTGTLMNVIQIHKVSDLVEALAWTGSAARA